MTNINRSDIRKFRVMEVLQLASAFNAASSRSAIQDDTAVALPPPIQPHALFSQSPVFAPGSPSFISGMFPAFPSPSGLAQSNSAPVSFASSPPTYISPKSVPSRPKYALATCSRINDRARSGRASIMQKIREGSTFKDMARLLIFEEFGGMDAAL